MVASAVNSKAQSNSCKIQIRIKVCSKFSHVINLGIAPDKMRKTSIDSTCVISSPNPMFDH